MVQGFLLQSAGSLYQAAMGLAAPAVFFLLLGFAVKRKALFKDMRRAIHEGGLNLSIAAFNAVFVVPILVLASNGLHIATSAVGLPILEPQRWHYLSPVAVVILAVFIGDFVGYWRHRLEHTPLLWPSHAVHHSDTEMTWLTLERFHPINRLTTFLIDSAALLALGFPPYAIVANSLMRHYYGYLIHADLPWTYDRFSAVFVSPVMHRWHHAAEPRAFNANFATVFSIFDRFFGTYYVPGPCNSALGVTDDMKPNLVGQLGYAFSPRAYSRLFAYKKTPKVKTGSVPK